MLALALALRLRAHARAIARLFARRDGLVVVDARRRARAVALASEINALASSKTNSLHYTDDKQLTAVTPWTVECPRPASPDTI